MKKPFRNVGGPDHGGWLNATNILIGVVVALLLAQGVSWYCMAKTRHKITDLQTDNQLTLNALDGAVQQRALAPLPGSNRLYLPELNITVPLTATTSSLRYTVDDASSGGDEVRLTSALMTDHAQHVKSCADMVRLKIEARPNAYSPDQSLYASVRLAGSQTLQIYASTTAECQAAWQTISPQTIAEAMKQAASY